MSSKLFHIIKDHIFENKLSYQISEEYIFYSAHFISIKHCIVTWVLYLTWITGK